MHDLPGSVAATHTRLNLHPTKIEEDDRYQYGGRWLTVYKIVPLDGGGLELYFVELVQGALTHAVIPEGTLGVTVYRPKRGDA
jgi:hypothetical protein